MPHDGVRCASCDDAEEVPSGALTYFFLEFRNVCELFCGARGPSVFYAPGWLALGPSPDNKVVLYGIRAPFAPSWLER